MVVLLLKEVTKLCAIMESKERVEVQMMSKIQKLEENVQDFEKKIPEKVKESLLQCGVYIPDLFAFLFHLIPRKYLFYLF